LGLTARSRTTGTGHTRSRRGARNSR
jgi:hypothetical protein